MKTAHVSSVLAVLAFLAILSGTAQAEISFDYYPGELHNVPDFSNMKPGQSGTLPDFDMTAGGKAAEDNYALRFQGGLKIDKPAAYIFYVTSDDGSKLWIDDKLVVDNDGDHAADEKSGKIKLAAGIHKIVLGFYQGAGDRALAVKYEGGDIAKTAVPKEALSPKIPDTIPAAPTNIPGNLAFEYFEGDFDKLPDFATLTAVSKGESDGFDLTIEGKARTENYALKFSGKIQIDKEGEYTFYTSSDDGSRLSIDDAVVVDNDGDHGNDEKEGKVKLTAGPHKITVVYYQHGGDRALQVSYAGPGIEKAVIPNAKLSK